MSDPSILLSAADSALVFSGSPPNTLTNAGLTVPGEFSGTLKQHIQKAQKTELSSVPMAAQPGQSVLESGELLPIEGDSLPFQNLVQNTDNPPFTDSVALPISILNDRQIFSDELQPAGTEVAEDLTNGKTAQINEYTAVDMRLINSFTHSSNRATNSPVTGSMLLNPLHQDISQPASNSISPSELAKLVGDQTVARNGEFSTREQLSAGNTLSVRINQALANTGIASNVNTDLTNVDKYSVLDMLKGNGFQKSLGLESRAAVLDSITRNHDIPLPISAFSLERTKLFNAQIKAQIGNGIDRVNNVATNLLSSSELGEVNTGGLAGVMSRQSGNNIINPLPSLTIPTTVGQPGWSNELGQRITWMANNELREAQLQLHPRNLGPVEIRIVFGQEQQLNVSFIASNPVTRDALEAALPRLREMFEQQGLNLAETDISHESFAERQKRSQSEGGNSTEAVANSDLSDQQGLENHHLSGAVQIRKGLIDAFA